MNMPSTCPDCGATLPTEATDGLCPKCLLKLARNDALQPETGGSEDATVGPDGSAQSAATPNATVRYFGD